MKAHQRIYRSTFFISLLLCVMITFSSSQTNAKEWTEAQKKVWKSVEAMWESFKEGDEQAAMAIYHNDSVIWLATRKLPTDKYNIRLAYRTWLSGPDKAESYELEPLTIHIFGDVANVYYTYVWGTKKNTRHISSRAMQTYIKQDNKWVLIGHMNALY